MRKQTALIILSAALLHWPARLRAAGDLRGYLCEDARKPFFSCVSGECRAARAGAIPEKFMMPKPAGTRRVFVVGESAAQLLGPGAAALAAGGRGAEIINCGMGGYDSRRIAAVLAEVLHYSPDLVVVISGNNEELPEVCPGPLPSLLRLRRRVLELYYSLFPGGEDRGQGATIYTHALELSRMSSLARKAGVPLVLAALPYNLADMPPLGGSLPLGLKPFAEGYAAYYSGRPGPALEKFRAAAAEAPRDPFVRYYAAKAAGRLGLAGEAARQFRAAALLDPRPARISPARDAMIREEAAKGGACLADLPKAFSGLAPGLPGFDRFMDGQHWRTALNGAAWNEIFRAAAGCGFAPPGPAAAFKEPPREEMRKRLSYAYSWIGDSGLREAALAQLGELRRAAPALLEEASASPAALEGLLIDSIWSAGRKSRAGELYPYFLAHLAETERRAGALARALALCGRALKLRPGDEHMLLLKAQLLAGAGRRAAAREAFMVLAGSAEVGREALALASAYGLQLPPWADAEKISAGNRELAAKLADSAVRLFEAGDKAGSRRLIGEALAADPANYTALASECSLRSAAGSADAMDYCAGAAFSAFVLSRGARCAPSADALLNCARLLSGSGDAAGASSALRRALAAAPASWGRLGEAGKLEKKLDEAGR